MPIPITNPSSFVTFCQQARAILSGNFFEIKGHYTITEDIRNKMHIKRRKKRVGNESFERALTMAAGVRSRPQ